MLPTFLSLLPVFLFLVGPALLTSSASQELEVRGHRTPRDTKQDAIKVVISEGCTNHGDSSDGSQGGKEIDLVPGSPLVLTHKIKLVPSGPGFGAGSGSCGCEADFAALRERLERLEREVSSLREKCGGPDGGCCTSKESKGPGCSMKPKLDECPNDCSDQGRCEDGKCVCFPGFSGPDCSDSNCPGNCNDNGKCVNGQCVCDPGFTGPECSQRGCPNNCNDRGRCVNGKCECRTGFTGPSCSDKSCPGNCNNRGRCVNGQCVCNDGFTGLDCSEKTCPNDCNDRGRCVNGKCVCDSGFTGDDCSEDACPGNCNNKGRCVNGQCVCNAGFTGHDCSEKACPNNCSKRGRCVNGKCVCDVGFAGPDCAAKGCPSNCNNKGRCVKGKCVCRRGFTGPDCSQCEEGMTGPNCDTAMSGVSQLSTRDITSTSVSVFWTPPPIQYDTYHITFTSQKESDQKITVQVEGSLTTFTQTGLAAGQEYTVTITGEISGRMGAETSTEFTTLISGPTNLHVVKTTSTSAVVQWEQTQGEIDRYRMTVSPSDGAGKSQEMTFPPGSDSAHIQQLEAGHLYDIILVAEKGTSQSEPATAQAVPGKFAQVTPATGQEDGDRDQELNTSSENQDFDQHRKHKDGSEADSVKGSVPSATVTARTRPVWYRRLNGPNRPLLRDRDIGKRPVLAKKPKPVVPTVRDRTQDETALTMRDPNVEPSSSERSEDKNPAIMPGTNSGTSSEEPSAGTQKQPDVGPEVQRSDTDPMSSEPTGAGRNHEKKCMNKLKLTHVKLPLKYRSSGCRSDGTVQEGKTTSDPHQGSSETDDELLHPSPDPLHKLLKDTFDSLNITTFSVHLSPPNLSDGDAATVRKQILGGLRPLSPSSLFPSSQSPSSSSSSSVESTSLISSLPSTAASLLASPPSLSPASNEADGATDHVTSPEDRKVPPRKGRIPINRLHPNGKFVRRPYPYRGPFNNRNLTAPHRPGSPFNRIPTRETETGHRPATAPEESSSGELNAPVSDRSADKDEAAADPSSGTEQNHKKMPTEVDPQSPSSTLPVRPRFPQRPGYPFQNQTHLNRRIRPRPTQLLNRATDSNTESASSSESPASSSPPSSNEEKSYPVEDTGSKVKDTEGDVGTHLPTVLNQTRDNGAPSSGRPRGHLVRPQPMYPGPFHNRTRPNLRPPQHPSRNPVRKPLPRKMNGNIISSRGSQTNQSEKENTPETPDNLSGEQGDIRPTQESGGLDPVGDNDLTQTTKPRDEGTHTPESSSDSGIHKVNDTKRTGTNFPRRRLIKKIPNSGGPRPITPPKRPPTRPIGSHRGGDPKAKQEFDGNTEQTRDGSSTSPTESDVSSSGDTREPLDYVGVTNKTSGGFTVLWNATEGKYKNFVVTRKESGKDEEPKEQENRKQQEEDNSENRNTEDENRVPESLATQTPTIKPATESHNIFKKVLPGSARSFQFEDLPPQKEYTVTLLGKGPGLLSRLHKLVISTGPEPPTDITFSKVTENSMTVSWTKPNTPVSGFKITYTHTEEGEPVSVSVDANDSSLGLSELTPGSSYEVNVISILGLDESDPVKDSVRTRPDAPTDLKAVNVTDTKALLLWRPALAAIDKYTIVYSSGKGSPLTVTVSGNAAEKQLSGLEGSTTYTVTITSDLGSQQSSPATTSFTTTSGSGKLRDLQATQVTPRTALLTWKPPSKPSGSYKLIYQTEGEEMKEVIVDATVTEYKLTKLSPGSKYTVQLLTEGGEGPLSTDFTTGTLRFPFPTDCSQELLNGIKTSGETEIYPQGKHGATMMVYCDMETDGGGWTVFQRRKDGSVDFFKGWRDYVNGFGDLSGEFWLGLDRIHNLSTMTRMNLRVDLRDGDETVFAKYSTFEVGKRNYKLTVGGYSGTAGDSLTYHNQRGFSTKDRDPAPFITRCAMSYRGGWWYKNCHEANLNGLYGIDVKHQGIIWTSWKGKEYSIAFTEMKMRPAAFSPPTRG